MSEGAGRLDRRFQFQVRVNVDDGHGNTVADWFPQFTVAGNRKYILRGAGEAVIAARLTAKTLATVIVRRSLATQQITADWRAIDTRSGEVFNIREQPQESDDRGYLSFLCETGVASG
jgi:head-tail adaptor